MYSPQISPIEALKSEVDEFVHAVEGKQQNNKKNSLNEGKKL